LLYTPKAEFDTASGRQLVSRDVRLASCIFITFYLDECPASQAASSISDIDKKKKKARLCCIGQVTGNKALSFYILRRYRYGDQRLIRPEWA
jgi:hypothetical protein